MKCLSSKDVLVIGISTNHKPLSMLCHNSTRHSALLTAPSCVLGSTYLGSIVLHCLPIFEFTRGHFVLVQQYAHVYFDELDYASPSLDCASG